MTEGSKFEEIVGSGSLAKEKKTQMLLIETRLAARNEPIMMIKSAFVYTEVMDVKFICLGLIWVIDWFSLAP